MHEHVHICSDSNSRQNMDKATITLLWFTNEVIYLFNYQKYKLGP
jgi:hypothetical protein